MKLYNSIKTLKNAIDTRLTTDVFCKLTTHIVTIKQNKTIKDYKRRFRFDIWYSLPENTRKNIISKSIPFSDWVGGYPDISDKHIETLLNKVIDLNFIVNVETGLILNSKKLLN